MLIRQFTTHVLAILAASPPVATYACPNVEELCQALAERLSLGRSRCRRPSGTRSASAADYNRLPPIRNSWLPIERSQINSSFSL